MIHAIKICWHLDFKFSQGVWMVAWSGGKQTVLYKTVKCHFGFSRLDVDTTREAGIKSDSWIMLMF